MEFAPPATLGGSCGALDAGTTPCAGGTLYYLVDGSATGVVRGPGGAYQSSYAILDNGTPGLVFAVGGTPTFGFWYGPPGSPANGYVLNIEATNYSFVSLVAASSLDGGTAGTAGELDAAPPSELDASAN